MHHDLLDIVNDLRYYVALGRTKQAEVLASTYTGPYRDHVLQAMDRGPLRVWNVGEPVLCLIGLIFGNPDLAARVGNVEDEQFAADLAQVLEHFYDKGYL